MSYEVSNKDVNAIAVNSNDVGSHGLRRGILAVALTDVFFEW